MLVVGFAWRVIEIEMRADGQAGQASRVLARLLREMASGGKHV
jgi:hypothetical protein